MKCKVKFNRVHMRKKCRYIAAIFTVTVLVMFCTVSPLILCSYAAPISGITYPATLYWNGVNFYSDEACTAENKMTDSEGTAYTNLPGLLADISGNVTIYMKAAYNVTGTETLNGGNHFVTLKRWSNSTNSDEFYAHSLIIVGSGDNLTLANIVIDGGAVWNTAINFDQYTSNYHRNNSGLTATASLVAVTDATLTINSGAVLQNNSTSVVGGGLSASSTSAITLNEGGLITNNRGGSGGGVRISATNFTMNGGEISYNDNWSAGDNGGGIQVGTGSAFTMEGGSVSHNKAGMTHGNGSDGGGVDINGDNACVIMNSGKISHNTSVGGGGGILTHSGSNSSFIMNGGEISYNKSLLEGGGGVIAYSGPVTINGGLITGNKGQVYSPGAGLGGGNWSAPNRTFTVNGGTITGNICYDTVTGGTKDPFPEDIRSNGTLVINGGTIGVINGNGSTGTTPLSGGGSTLVSYTVTIPGMSASTLVTGVYIEDTLGNPYDYGSDMYTDASGILTLWLPTGYTVYNATTYTDSEYTLYTFESIQAQIKYTNLKAGNSLTANMVGPAATAYQWQEYNTETSEWVNMSDSTGSTYTTTNDDIGKKLRVVINTAADSYTSGSVTIKSDIPIFTINIPAGVEMGGANTSFEINGILDGFTGNENIDVKVSSDFMLSYSEGPSTDDMTYTLYKDPARTSDAVANNGTVANFSTDGNNSAKVYFKVNGTPRYAGTYSDILTFTITLNPGI